MRVSTEAQLKLLVQETFSALDSGGLAEVLPQHHAKPEMRIKLPANNLTAVMVLLGLILCMSAACRPGERLPAKSYKEYEKVVRAFYVGLTALQVGDDVRAED